MVLLHWSLFVILWNAGIWKRKFSSVVESVFCRRRIFPVRLRTLFLTDLQAEEVCLDHCAWNFRVSPNLEKQLESIAVCTRKHSPFLVPPPNSAVVPACSVMGVSWTSPKPSLLDLGLLEPPWPPLLRVPGQAPLTFSEMVSDVTRLLVFWEPSCQCFPFLSQDLPGQSGAQLASLGWGWRFLPGDPFDFYWINVSGY